MTAYPAVATTGHRSLTDSQTTWLRHELDRVLAKLRDTPGATDAASGMAIGADTEFGWSALHAGLKLHAHVPFPQQPDAWNPAQQAEYRRLLDRCASRTEYGSSFNVGWYFKRNDGLLNFAEDGGGLLVAVWDPAQRDKSGTFDTVRKAAVRRLPVVHVDVAALVTHGPGCSCVMSLVAADEPTLF